MDLHNFPLLHPAWAASNGVDLENHSRFIPLQSPTLLVSSYLDDPLLTPHHCTHYPHCLHLVVHFVILHTHDAPKALGDLDTVVAGVVLDAVSTMATGVIILRQNEVDDFDYILTVPHYCTSIYSGSYAAGHILLHSVLGTHSFLTHHHPIHALLHSQSPHPHFNPHIIPKNCSTLDNSSIIHVDHVQVH